MRDTDDSIQNTTWNKNLYSLMNFKFWFCSCELHNVTRLKLIFLWKSWLLGAEHERAPLVFPRARVERRSRFSLKSASWAPLVIFLEERMNERRPKSGAQRAALVFSGARVERRSFIEKWALSWAPLAIFLEERELSAAQILSLKVLYCSKIWQISLFFCKENVLTSLKLT